MERNEINYKKEFLKIADWLEEGYRLHGGIEGIEKWKRGYYIYSYGIRGLIVTYKVTGDKKYLERAIEWCNLVIHLQGTVPIKGIPKSMYGYYMGYGGEIVNGIPYGFYIADTISMANAILATAESIEDKKEKECYISSVKSYADYIISTFWLEDSGAFTVGVADRKIYLKGVKGKEEFEEYWCATGLGPSLLWWLYDLTNKEIYRKVAIANIKWILKYNFFKREEFKRYKVSMIFYICEGLLASYAHLPSNSKLHQEVKAHLEEVIKWLLSNQTKEGGWYTDIFQWRAKVPGLPLILKWYYDNIKQDPDIYKAIEKAIQYLTTETSKKELSMFKDVQTMCFAAISWAYFVKPESVFPFIISKDE